MLGSNPSARRGADANRGAFPNPETPLNHLLCIGSKAINPNRKIGETNDRLDLTGRTYVHIIGAAHL
jgi:hypothetical protein